MVEVDGKISFNAVSISKYNGDPIFFKFPFRELGETEILIKIQTSTIHPADLAFVKGQYGRSIPDIFPIIPGGEGSGIIAQVGSKLDKNLIGKHVGLIANSNKTGSFYGLWGEYHYTSLQYCLIFDKELDYNLLTFSMGNPLTALGFLDTLKKHKVSAVVQNGSTSAFGKMFIKLCAQNGIKNISLVRRKEAIKNLLDIGAYKVISTREANWKNELKQVAQEENATVCFECVGGDFTGKILNAMPRNSTIYHFGNLELRRLEDIDTSDFIFEKKVMKGWWLMEWINGLNMKELEGYKAMIKESMESGSDLFITGYSKIFTLENFEEAFIYYISNMSEGKVILEMHKN